MRIRKKNNLETPEEETLSSGKEREMPVLHPFLIAAFPVLRLCAGNVGEVSSFEALQLLLAVLGITAVLYIALRFILKNKQEAGLIVSLGLAVFFVHGYLWEVVNNLVSIRGAFPWLLFYAAIFITVTALIVLQRKHLRNATIILNVVAVVMIVMPLFNIISYSLKARPKIPDFETQKADHKVVASRSKLPDIYYIIFDTYMSEEGLKEYFHYDNSKLTAFLKEKGFYIPEDAHSNYARTHLSLPSSLNMTYLDFLKEDLASVNAGICGQILKDNQVTRFLKKQGYTYTLFLNNWTTWGGRNYADSTPIKRSVFGSELFVKLKETTMLSKYFSQFNTRNMVEFALTEIPKVSKKTERPNFVFVHILAPHAPFLYMKTGEQFKGKQPDERNGEAWGKAYIEQLDYMNGKIMKLVDSLIPENGRKPVIIIQGDHGTRVVDKSVDEQTSILNAYYLPQEDGTTAKLYGQITPVNSFREIFNMYFKTSYKQLPDKVYYYTPEHKYKWKDMTDQVIEPQ